MERNLSMLKYFLCNLLFRKSTNNLENLIFVKINLQFELQPHIGGSERSGRSGEEEQERFFCSRSESQIVITYDFRENKNLQGKCPRNLQTQH